MNSVEPIRSEKNWKTYAEIRDSLDKYYSYKGSNNEKEEADKVSVRIAERLSQPRPFEKRLED